MLIKVGVAMFCQKTLLKTYKTDSRDIQNGWMFLNKLCKPLIFSFSQFLSAMHSKFSGVLVFDRFPEFPCLCANTYNVRPKIIKRLKALSEICLKRFNIFLTCYILWFWCKLHFNLHLMRLSFTRHTYRSRDA